MSLIDLWKGFHSDAIQQEYPPSPRVLFDTLIFKLNERFWGDELVLSERDLIQMTGLKKTTLHDAKQFLASRHIIKCTPFKNKTSYSLGEKMQELLDRPIPDQPATSKRPVSDQSPTTSRPVSDQLLATPTKRVREDLKTKDLKTLDVKTDISSTTTIARAGAHVNKENELDKLVDYWEESRFGRLSIELISKLEVYLKKYGYSEVRAAMDSAKESNGSPYGVSFKYFATILENRQKGVDKRGRSDSVAASPKPERDKLADPKPWDKYAPAL